MKKICSFFVACLTLIVSACSTSQNIETYNEPRFNQQAPINLKVNKITIDSVFSPSFTRPNVEHLFPVSIEKTAKLWASDRLKAVDFASASEAIFTINDASVTEELIKGENLFTPDSLKYRATLDVVLKVTDTDNKSSAETQIKTWRELIIPANTSLAEKEKYWSGMVQKLFESFNEQMEKKINQYLVLYVDGAKIETIYY